MNYGMERIVRICKPFLNVHGTTWSRRVYLLRAARLCHTSSFQSSDHDQDEGGVATSSVQSAAFPQKTVDLRTSPAEDLEREVGKFQSANIKRFLLRPDQPPDARILRVAILGAPNAGKSTLVNSLMRWKVNPVSVKVHTTRKNTLGVYTENNTQIVFTDTPGVITSREQKKHCCEKSLVVDPKRSLEEVDLVGVVVDTSNHFTRYEMNREVLKILEEYKHIPSVLILNKVDDLKNRHVLLEITNSLTDGIVGGKKVPASPIRKATKKKKEKMKTIFAKLEEKYGKLSIKKKGSAKEAESLSSLNIRDDEVMVTSEKSDVENNFDDQELKYSIANKISSERQFGEDHDNLSVKTDSDSSAETEHSNTVHLSQNSTNNMKTNFLKFDHVESERLSDITSNYDQSNNNISNVSSDEKFHHSDAFNEESLAGKETSSYSRNLNTENYISESNYPLQHNNTGVDETDNKEELLLAARNSAGVQEISGKELDNADKDAHSKTEVERHKTDWEKFMPREVEVKHGWPHFERVFMVSSLYGDGVLDLLDYFLDNAKEGDWMFHSSFVTNEEPFELAKQVVWTKILDHVNGYIAYKIFPEVSYWQIDENDILKIVMTLQVKHVDKMIGPGGQKIRKISEEAQQSLMDAFRCEVQLKLIVKKAFKRK